MATTSSDDDRIPVRMLNEFAYCPRLFHLMRVEGLWADNAYTTEGRWVHRRVDKAVDDALAEPDPAGARAKDEGDAEPKVARSVQLGSDRLGIVAKLDLVATEGDEALPVETKRGRVPDNPQRSWEPERIQLMAQGLLLREHGYVCQRGVLYFAGSRTRVEVPFTDELEARTLRVIEQAKRAATSTALPPPLEDSPKCWGCSLSGICLPDETRALRDSVAEPSATPIRRLYPSRENATPLVVQEPGARVGKTGTALVVTKEREELAKVPLKDVDELVLCGNVSVTAPALHLLCERGIPITHLGGSGWFYGVTTGVTLRNAYDRAAQFAAAEEPQRCLDVARAIVTAKATNQRTMLRRNASPSCDERVERMRALARGIPHARDLGELLGIEGSLAKTYFEGFPSMLRPKSDRLVFDFHGRNRRPPRDPINALLSFGYAMLTKECTIALLGVGLDPYWGLFHQPRHGRPSLALDLMEEFRPLIVDSAVLTAVNTGALDDRHFVVGANACSMKPAGRKRFIEVYAARLEQLVTHPVFDYRCSWRQVIRVQARLLARHLRGDIPEYPGMTTR